MGKDLGLIVDPLWKTGFLREKFIDSGVVE